MSCKKGILRNFAKLTGKHLRQRLFFNKVCEIWYSTFFTEHLLWLAIGLQLYWKIVSGTGVFQLVLRNLIAHLFSQNTSGGCFWISKKMLLQTFSVTPKWIYNIHKKIQKIYCKRFERIPCLFSSNIFNYDWFGSFKILIGWQYNSDSMYLSILHFFTSRRFK